MEPFVSFLNDREGTRFSHVRCLDTTGVTGPQPEALYCDAITGAEMVIECKAIAWPRSFVEKHATDHRIIEIVLERLRGRLDERRPYELALSGQITGPRRQRDEFAKGIAAEIVQRLDHVHAGEVIGSRATGREWQFRAQTSDEREYFEPSTGVVITMPRPGGLFLQLDANLDIPAPLVAELRRCLRSAADKFRNYDTMRRIVLLSAHGAWELEHILLGRRS